MIGIPPCPRRHNNGNCPGRRPCPIGSHRFCWFFHIQFPTSSQNHYPKGKQNQHVNFLFYHFFFPQCMISGLVRQCSTHKKAKAGSATHAVPAFALSHYTNSYLFHSLPSRTRQGFLELNFQPGIKYCIPTESSRPPRQLSMYSLCAFNT